MPLVSECEFTLIWGFYDFRSDRFFVFLFSCSFPHCRSVRVVPGFECNMRLSFQCDEVQVLVVRRDIHNAY